MVTFQARIEAEDKDYSKVAAKGKEIIDLLETIFQGVNCPQHPFHQIKVLVSFSKSPGMEIEVINSCCKKFTELFEKKINQVTV